MLSMESSSGGLKRMFDNLTKVDAFRGILLSQIAGKTHAIERDLPLEELSHGEVDIDVSFSTLNYKDALAITGRGAIVKSWPMVPGIDCVGRVRESKHAAWRKGEPIVVTGWGLGETSWGGLADRCRIKGEWGLAPPEDYEPYECMAIGTAGVTAALAAIAIEDHAAMPDCGRILVTGAAGGVGSIAVALLSRLGHDVIASTGRLDQTDYLKSLGATSVISRDVLQRECKPLEKEQWHAVIDSVGGTTLISACAATRWNGAVAACGLAGGADFNGTVMPFILRGVTLYGINSVFVDNKKRARAWSLLASHIPSSMLRQISSEIRLQEVVQVSSQILAGNIRGRTVVRI